MPKETSLQTILDSEQRVIRDLLQEMKRNTATLRDLWATHKKLVEDHQQLAHQLVKEAALASQDNLVSCVRCGVKRSISTASDTTARAVTRPYLPPFSSIRRVYSSLLMSAPTGRHG